VRDPGMNGLKMEPGADRDSTRASAGTGSGKGISKRQPKETKPKPNATPSGTRFQCPRCPKNFSRIENLTRHQANRKYLVSMWTKWTAGSLEKSGESPQEKHDLHCSAPWRASGASPTFLLLFMGSSLPNSRPCSLNSTVQ
jgi:hypothetical protein